MTLSLDIPIKRAINLQIHVCDLTLKDRIVRICGQAIK